VVGSAGASASQTPVVSLPAAIAVDSSTGMVYVADISQWNLTAINKAGDVVATVPWPCTVERRD